MNGGDYIDFEMEISSGVGNEYHVIVINSPAGEGRAVMRFPFTEEEITEILDRMQMGNSVRDFGLALFEALFVDEVRHLYYTTCNVAARQDNGVRLKLRVLSLELMRVPWELLYDPRENDFIALSRRNSVVRYMALPRSIGNLKTSIPLRMLGVAVSPRDLPPLNIRHDQQVLESAIAELQSRELIQLEWVSPSTWRNLQEVLLSDWHIFYFVGHGEFNHQTQSGVIALEQENGHADLLDATRFCRLLADHHSLRLVVLNSCEGARGNDHDAFSSVGTALVRRGIPVVVAMQTQISDAAAIEFGRSFYQALAARKSVEEAVIAARQGISLAVRDAAEWASPVLYLRANDSMLFNFIEEEKVKIVLSWTAYELHNEQVDALPSAEIARIVEECLNSINTRFEANELIAQLIRDRKLKRADGNLSFYDDIQRAFYLAIYLKDLVNDVPNYPLDGLTDETIKHLTILVANPAEIVDTLIQENKLELAARCINAGAAVSEVTMRELIKRIVAVLPNGV